MDQQIALVLGRYVVKRGSLSRKATNHPTLPLPCLEVPAPPGQSRCKGLALIVK